MGILASSMATPGIAGAVADILSANPSLEPEQVKQILMQTAKDLGPAGWDPDTGAGRAQLMAAIDAAKAAGGVQAPVPAPAQG